MAPSSSCERQYKKTNKKNKNDKKSKQKEEIRPPPTNKESIVTSTIMDVTWLQGLQMYKPKSTTQNITGAAIYHHSVLAAMFGPQMNSGDMGIYMENIPPSYVA